MEKVYEIYIKTTPERLWHAITDPETRRIPWIFPSFMMANSTISLPFFIWGGRADCGIRGSQCSCTVCFRRCK